MSHDFRTIVSPLKNRGLIDHHHKIMMVGSCFSDNIGKRLQESCFNVNINPFGTLYNPASIACAINAIIKNSIFSIDNLFKHPEDNRWHSFMHHSSFSSIDKHQMLEKINEKINEAHDSLKQASAIIITFGSAWVYKLKSNNQVVSNCHKLPQSTFNRILLSISEIVESWTEIITALNSYNDKIKIIFTISPIRHKGDGLHGNQVSKSILHVAINELITHNDSLIYFPAYEIMNDDLRDYRFYASDMLHPSDIAIEYIYNLFSQSFMTEETISIASECEKFTRRLNHKIMSDDIEAINRSQNATNEIGVKLYNKYPFLKQVQSKIN